MGELVKLNVGGHRFVTTRSTLTRSGETFFNSLLSGRIPAIKDELDHYFIDRDGQYFAVLLEFLRTGELLVPPPLRREAVLREAAFYLIELDPATTGKRRPRNDGVYTRCHYGFRGATMHTTNEFLVFISNSELLSGLHGLRHFPYSLDEKGLITYSADTKGESFCFEFVRHSFQPFTSPRGRVFLAERPVHICSLRASAGQLQAVDRHLLRLYFHDESTIFVLMQPEQLDRNDYQEQRHSYMLSQKDSYPLYTFEVSYEQQSFGFTCIVTARELWLRYKGMPVWNALHEVAFDQQDLRAPP